MTHTAPIQLDRLLVAADAIERIAIQELGVEPETAEIEELLRGVLHAPRDLLAAVAAGLVTPAEAAHAVAAYVHTWLSEKRGGALNEQLALMFFSAGSES